jgi:hypothetical protein
MLVRPLVKVMLSASVRMRRTRSVSSTPRTVGRSIGWLMTSTEGIVRPIVASTEPRKILTARCI